MRNAFYLFLFSTLILFSCSDEQFKVGQTEITIDSEKIITEIPYASDSTLSIFAQDPLLNNYKSVRKMAIIDIALNFNQTMNWNGTSLSQKPVIVYDYDSKPQYYEFIVLDSNGKPQGTVTTLAKRQAGDVTAYVLPWVRDYKVLSSKGASYKTFVGNYPMSPYYGIPNKSGETPDVLVDGSGTKVSEIPLADDAAVAINRIESMSTDELNKSGITNKDSTIQAIKEKNKELLTYGSTFWGVVDSLEIELNQMSDEEILARINENKGEWTSYSEYIIPQFNNEKLKRTRWAGWCGPSAIAWIYRGFYDSYHGKYLPLYGDAGFFSKGVTNSSGLNIGRAKQAGFDRGFYYFNGEDNLTHSWVNAQSDSIDGGLYADIANSTLMFLWHDVTRNENGPVLPALLGQGLFNATWRYGVSPLPLLDTPRHIRNGLPAITWVDWFSHYMVAFGCKERYWNWELIIKIFGKKIKLAGLSVKTGEWLYVTDNGYETGSNDYYPFWRNDYFTFTPDYGVTKLY